MAYRFPAAAVFFLVMSFIFFVIWATMSILLGAFQDALVPMAEEISNPADRMMALNEITMFPIAFGIICLIFFVSGILLLFFFDTFKEDPYEVYYER